MAVGATIYVESLPDVYRGEAIVALSPRPDVPSASADSVRVLAPKYVEYVTAPATVRGIADSAGIGESDLQSGVDADLAEETGNLTITVDLGTPTAAAEAANAFAEGVEDFSVQDPLLTAQTIAPALEQTVPAGPPRTLLEVAALLAGLLLGVSIGFLVERGRPVVRSWRDIARATAYPVVGRVPAIRSLRARPWEAFSEPRVAAAIRTIRTVFERERSERPIDIVSVTSPGPGDGKTTIAALFAESLARLGLKTLLVDADLRRPGLSDVFGLRQAHLDKVLRGAAPLRAAIVPGWVPGLQILGSAVDPEAGDFLARGLSGVLEEALQTFEIVVIDTPPLLGTDDARTIARLTSGVLLVVAARSQTRSVNEAVLALESLKAPVLGVVANRIHEHRPAYY